LNQWIDDGTLPVSLYDSIGGELGASILLPSGKAFFLGSTGHTALYAPTGGTNPGTWAAGPDIPNGLGTPDAPAAMMMNGKILCAVSPQLYTDPNGTVVFPAPTSFYEYDPVANSFTPVNTPSGSTENYACYITNMLDLPDGNVLFSNFDKLYIYQPAGPPLAAGKPTISSITPNGAGSYHLVGARLNGISEGAAYGDDGQMASNYPIVRLSAGGNVYYARTYNWSSTGVMRGDTPVTTEFSLPSALPPGAYSLVAVANGISSDPVSFDPNFRISAMNFSPLNGFTLTWTSQAGLFYKVLRSNDASFTTSTIVASNLQAAGPTQSYTDSSTAAKTATKMFYRVSLQP
jgi:hypothetical protein